MKINEVKKGDYVMLDVQYYESNREKRIDVSPYLIVEDVIESANTLILREKDGTTRNVNVFYCQKDELQSLEDIKKAAEDYRLIKKGKSSRFTKDNMRVADLTNKILNCDEGIIENIILDMMAGRDISGNLKTTKNETAELLVVLKALDKYIEVAENATKAKKKVNRILSTLQLNCDYVYTKELKMRNTLYNQSTNSNSNDRNKNNANNNANSNSSYDNHDYMEGDRADDRNNNSYRKAPKNTLQKQIDTKQNGNDKVKNLPKTLMEPFDKVPSVLIDMNEDATKQIDGYFDRALKVDKEIQKLQVVLNKRDRKNALIVGKQGCGKTALVKEFVNRINDGSMPDMENKRVYKLEVGALLAGTKYRGEFEKKLTDVLNFAKENRDRVILFIDEIHQIMSANSHTEGGDSMADLMKTALTDGISIIGATTTEEYQYFNNDKAVKRRFDRLDLKEKTREEVLEILNVEVEKYERYHGVHFSKSIVNALLDPFDQGIVSKLSESENLTSNIDFCKNGLDTIASTMKTLNISQIEAYKIFLENECDIKEISNSYGRKKQIGFDGVSKEEQRDEQIDIFVKQFEDDIKRDIDKELEVSSEDVEYSNTENKPRKEEVEVEVELELDTLEENDKDLLEYVAEDEEIKKAIEELSKIEELEIVNDVIEENENEIEIEA